MKSFPVGGKSNLKIIRSIVGMKQATDS